MKIFTNAIGTPGSTRPVNIPLWEYFGHELTKKEIRGFARAIGLKPYKNSFIGTVKGTGLPGTLCLEGNTWMLTQEEGLGDFYLREEVNSGNLFPLLEYYSNEGNKLFYNPLDI